MTEQVHRLFQPRAEGFNRTVGADFARKTLISSTGNKYVLGLWDTAGHERFDSMIRLFYRGASAAIVCFDLSSEESWEKAKSWMSELQAKEEACKIYLCGTKLDLLNAKQRQQEAQRVTLFAKEINAKYIETSSHTGKNIGKLFQIIIEDFENNPSGKVIENILLTGENVERKCC
ncbi:ras-related protein Rab-24-like isoform X2 [Ischnura elegans]|uniref:ras-related protein Rab-24-like isoform X2 n=1 Tax=Ischnura elegans TaxID=197161 RepID=UPI001ED8795F|nr:ras-related protein Rab-24-like isoform X2 [Ischnura elegans]